ncbi:ATP-binding protein [Candidatus Gottesmanbacteria bacterium]|nr:ATP-binding protein [Candidatus Gottesmanbacteria bacterium]
MNSVLKTMLLEWRDRPLPQIIDRDEPLMVEDMPAGKALVVTGFRRVGKTYLLFHAIKKLLNSYSRSEIVYLNFEDERIPLSTQVLTNLIPEIQAVFGQKPKFLFLDEIQNMPHWSKWLRRILDIQQIKIVVTGSSSKVSSLEIPTELRGRAWEKMVFPLNFKEFLRFKGQAFDFQKIKYVLEEQAKMHFLFEEYLKYGGLPEVVLIPTEKKPELLQNYFQTVVRKEMIERFKIRNEEALKMSLKLVLNSTYVTVSKLYNSFKSMGLPVGKTTLNNYLSFAESAYFLKQLYFYSPSMRSQLQYPRKLHIIDNGFITALSTKFSQNFGRLFENLVFWHLFKNNDNIFYYRDERGEVDLVVFQDNQIKTLYQVCYDLSDRETLEREIKSLIRAGRKLKTIDLRVITLKAEEFPTSPKVKVISYFDIL